MILFPIIASENAFAAIHRICIPHSVTPLYHTTTYGFAARLWKKVSYSYIDWFITFFRVVFLGIMIESLNLIKLYKKTKRAAFLTLWLIIMANERIYENIQRHKKNAYYLYQHNAWWWTTVIGNKSKRKCDNFVLKNILFESVWRVPITVAIILAIILAITFDITKALHIYYRKWFAMIWTAQALFQ